MPHLREIIAEIKKRGLFKGVSVFFDRTFLHKEDSKEKISSARMTNNRMQALDGQGYRECYMEKIKEVAQSEASSSAKEYWFGDENKEGDEKKGEENSPSWARQIPNQARITSTRIKAYTDSLAKPSDIDAIDEPEQL